MAEILKNEFCEKDDVSDIDVKSKQAQAITNMEQINYLNWQQILQFNWIKEGETKLESNKPIPDFESIWIGQETLLIMENPKTFKFLLLPSINLKVNLYSSVTENMKGELKAIRKATTNNRDIRIRPESTQKSDGSIFNINSI